MPKWYGIHSVQGWAWHLDAQVDDQYEYVTVYMDDLAIASKDPSTIIDVLTNTHGFKLKGTGPIKCHLRMVFHCDEHGTLRISSWRYIDKMVDTYQQLFGCKLSTKTLSAQKGDHPEIDDSEFLNEEDTQKYQSMVSMMQWAISSGWLDISTAVMTLSNFWAQPWQGHLNHVKHIYSYLYKMKDANIVIHVQEPDYSGIQDEVYNWANTVYSNVTELIPKDAPQPLGNYVTLSHYIDANLYHNMLTGQSITGILHFLNKMPIDWFTKKQATVEMATYGSKFVAACTCIDQVADLQLTLWYLGVPVHEMSYMFGDNKTVVNSSSKPHAKLHKHHNALSFHCVHEAVASKYVNFSFLDGRYNPADILSKHWGYQQIWTILKLILFFHSDTAELYELD